MMIELHRPQFSKAEERVYPLKIYIIRKIPLLLVFIFSCYIRVYDNKWDTDNVLQ
jgi:hypothetical protein